MKIRFKSRKEISFAIGYFPTVAWEMNVVGHFCVLLPSVMGVAMEVYYLIINMFIAFLTIPIAAIVATETNVQVQTLLT